MWKFLKMCMEIAHNPLKIGGKPNIHKTLQVIVRTLILFLISHILIVTVKLVTPGDNIFYS